MENKKTLNMERALQIINLKHSQIEGIFRRYFKDVGSLQSYQVLSGGAINTTYKIQWNEEYFVLKIYVRDKYRVDVEKQIYSLIQGNVSVPELLFASTSNEQYPFAIFRFVEAKHLLDVEKKCSSILSYDLGKSLSKIHSFTFPRAGLFGKTFSIEILFEENSSPYFEYCVKHLSKSSNTWKRLGTVRAKKLKQFVEMHKDFFLNIESLEKGYKDNEGGLPIDWIQRARITDFINVVQLLNVQVERPKLFRSLLKSVDFTMDRWQDLDEMIRGG